MPKGEWDDGEDPQAAAPPEFAEELGIAAAATSIGIFLGTMARSMPRFGLRYMLVAIPMMILSGRARTTPGVGSSFGTVPVLMEIKEITQA